MMLKKPFQYPLFTVVLLALLMWLLPRFDLSFIVFESSVILALVSFAIGTAIILVAAFTFRRAKTTVNPATPDKSSQLVTQGPYRYSRNPMYLGFGIWLLAYALYLANIATLLILVLFIFIANYLYIIPEEQALNRLFKVEFENYKHKVRRWL